MDKLRIKIIEESTWAMIFVDDIVLPRKSIEEVMPKSESWRNDLKRGGLKVE